MSGVPENKRSSIPGRIVTLVAIGALSLGLWLGLRHFQDVMRAPPPLKSATALNQPRSLEPFALTDHNGKPFTLDSLKGQWSFLAFGYAHCPDVCPTTLATLDAVARQTQGRDISAEFIFVSVDPERDTPEKLGEYVTYFNPAFRGATGPHPFLQGLLTQLGVLYARVEDQQSEMGYLMDHSASVLLIDPLGRLAAVFSAPQNAPDMAQDFFTITRQANQRF